MRSGESYIQTLRDASVGAGDGRWSSVADDKICLLLMLNGVHIKMANI